MYCLVPCILQPSAELQAASSCTGTRAGGRTNKCEEEKKGPDGISLQMLCFKSFLDAGPGHASAELHMTPDCRQQSAMSHRHSLVSTHRVTYGAGRQIMDQRCFGCPSTLRKWCHLRRDSGCILHLHSNMASHLAQRSLKTKA